MKTQVNWAIVAPGNIANKMAEAISASGRTDKSICAYAIASRNIERASAFAQKWNFQKAYGSYEELFNDPNVDAVYVSNPHPFHHDVVVQALQHGKHVLCEKPAGCNMAQLTDMLDFARRQNLFFMEAMWSAFNPCLNAVRQRIGAGVIGDVKNIGSRFCNRFPYAPHSRFFDPDQAGGALLDLGIYNIYFSMMMAQSTNVVKYNSLARIEKGVDMWNSVNLLFDNGITASFQSAVNQPTVVDTHNAIIYGEKGFIFVKNFFMTEYAEVQLFTADGNEYRLAEKIDMPFDVNGYEYEMRAATQCILRGETESAVHPHSMSKILCSLMDSIRADWGLKYPFEK
ncbi:MAG: Gfo/Idh/MocA family oxidoreductase [Bacteroidales bacterium]|nr:Gfo/Idh/MocA family oxidoreductase [Bacteroidales bacterium]